MSSGTRTGTAGGNGRATHAGGKAAGAGAGTDATGAPPGDGGRADGASGGGVRERIDDLDRRIIALVQERRAVSAGARRTRRDGDAERGTGAGPDGDASTARGGAGLAREMEILNRYRSELGRPGTQLAMTLLSLSRG
jgi:chorismate mutase